MKYAVGSAPKLGVRFLLPLPPEEGQGEGVLAAEPGAVCAASKRPLAG